MNEEQPPIHQQHQLPSTALVGLVIGPWGFNGYVRIRAETDNPRRFSPNSQLLVNGQTLHIERRRWHKGFALVKFRGIDTQEEALRLQGARLEVPMDMVAPLDPDTYYHFQILDMEVWTSEGELLGRVEDILSTGSNDVYVVLGESGEVLVPALKDVIVKVDTERGRMTVDLPQGLR